MSNLDHNTVPECKALFPDAAVVTAKRENHNLDIRIGETVYEDVEIHYHCLPTWESQSHPHDKAAMAQAFEVDDEVLVLCNDNRAPVYVVGFKEDPKLCEPVIVLRAEVGEGYDYWYYVVSLGQGFHADPDKPAPSSPEIVSKWWTCNEFDPIEYYTRSTPALDAIATAECGDSCGLINFEDECCDEAENEDNEETTWDNCPCGGEWGYDPVYGDCCIDNYDCEGGNCGDFTGKLLAGGCQSSSNKTNRQSVNCDEGYSWNLSIGDLSERLTVGPRSIMQGTDAGNVCTVDDQTCGPYPCVKMYCPDLQEETCICDLAHGGYSWGGQECCGDPTCSNWFFEGDYRYVTERLSSSTTVLGGCIEITTEVKSAPFVESSVPLETIIAVGEKETSFVGSWLEDKSGDGSVTMTKKRVGFGNSCQGSCAAGTLDTDSYNKAAYAYTEISYGIGGWHTVVAPDGRFAVLIPKMSLSCSAQEVDGDASGSIISTTTALLRIVDDADHDYELADGDSNYNLTGLPTERDDLGIQPNCWPSRDLPLDIELRGFHWLEDWDWIFTAFKLGGEFEAGLVRKADDVWQEEDMSGFIDFVEANGLEEHRMYLA